MKKKFIAPSIAIVLIASFIFVPTVQAFTENALSVFRVGDAKTITITVDDIQELMAYMESREHGNHMWEYDEQDLWACENGEAIGTSIFNASREPSMLDNVNEFNYFSFNLPGDLGEPDLFAQAPITETMVLDVNRINRMLEKAGSNAFIDDSFNGREISITTPPSITAVYDDLIIMATQNFNIDAPTYVKQELYNAFIRLPMIPVNIQSQLAAIDVDTRDIYLPVLTGFGREVNLSTFGSTVGYIYSLDDLRLFTQTLPDDLRPDIEDIEGDNMSTIIFTRDGVLYIVVGDRTDSELIRIARGIS